MSLLLSDSLVGLVDEDSLSGNGSHALGTVEIKGKTYAVDSFITDRKTIRVHAIGEFGDSISIMNLRDDVEAKVTLGEDEFIAKGRILQVGWERVNDGGRLVISVNMRDK